MKYVPNTLLIRAIRWMLFPACLAVLAFPSFTPAALAAASSTDDTVVIASEDTLSNADMGANRGGTITTTVTSDQTMNSTSTGNTMNVAGSLTNGPIFVGDNFGNGGLGSFVMNTGNNSVINSGVSLSVLMMQ